MIESSKNSSKDIWKKAGIATCLLLGLLVFLQNGDEQGTNGGSGERALIGDSLESSQYSSGSLNGPILRSTNQDNALNGEGDSGKHQSVEAFIGYVFNGFGEPISNAKIELNGGEAEGKSWDDGNFYLPNHDGVNEAQLDVSHPHFISKTVSAHAGVPVTVTLGSTWRLEGQFLLDPGLKLEFLEVILVVDSPEESGNELYERSLLSESGHFSFYKVQPGEYQILLRGMFAGQVVYSTNLFLNNIGGVKEIPNIDLRGRLKRIRILVVDELAGEISLAAAYDSAWNDITQWSEEGLEIYALDKEVILGRVSASGFLDTELMELSDGITVEMKRGIWVEISLPSFPPHPEGWEWGFSLVYTKDGSIEGAPSIAPVSLHDGWGIVSRPGKYFLRLDLLEIEKSNGLGAMELLDLGEAQSTLFIEVPDDVTQYSASVVLSAECSRVITERASEIASQE